MLNLETATDQMTSVFGKSTPLTGLNAVVVPLLAKFLLTLNALRKSMLGEETPGNCGPLVEHADVADPDENLNILYTSLSLCLSNRGGVRT